MGNTHLSDAAFIECEHIQTFPIPLLSEENYLKLPANIRNHVQENQIKITRKDTGESRTFNVNLYAGLILEGFFKRVDSTTVYNEKLQYLVNAKHRLNHLAESLYPFDNYEFKREFKKINDTIEYLKSHRELGTFDDINTTPQNGKLPDKASTKTDILTDGLAKYRFYELKKIKEIKNNSEIVARINENDLPYKIAMLHFLGFIEYLQKEHFKTKDEMYKELAKLFDTTAREISGNIRVLNPMSKEDRERYTSHQHIESVKQDYYNIKRNL